MAEKIVEKKCPLKTYQNCSYAGFCQIVVAEDGIILNPAPSDLRGLFIVEALRQEFKTRSVRDINVYRVTNQLADYLELEKLDTIPEIFLPAAEKAMEYTNNKESPVIFIACWGD